MRLIDQTLSPACPPYSRLSPSSVRSHVCFLCHQPLFSALFYLKHYIVAEGTLGYLVEGINFILNLKYFQLSMGLCCPLCPGAQFSTVFCCIVPRFVLFDP
ncbi:unnamed protein product [Rangifer tarandus platyrhynchus]|uniref:Uncharacterized protein n=2 Tax=Rangifer tarandus platyrhynchus TaxID=3082113 RepID=A0AC59ZCV4_RANTA|nr:unnamed protein product [Rangifer tarandus platyrhynchus]